MWHITLAGVPERSQAYAALLCHAIRFGGDSARLYQKYLAHGATVDFDLGGRVCPVPEFSRAQRMQDQTTVRQLERLQRRLRRAAGVFAVLAGAAAVWVTLRRGRRTSG